MLRTVVEDELYKKQLEALGDVKRLDQVLSGLIWALSSKPDELSDVIPGTQRLRVAKSDGYGRTPKLRIWYVIESTEEVRLLSIEQDDSGES
jgi:hypothetical protein